MSRKALQLVYYVSYHENKSLGPSFLSANEAARDIEALMGRKIETQDFMYLEKLGFELKFEGDRQRFESSLKKQGKLKRNPETGQISFTED